MTQARFLLPVVCTVVLVSCGRLLAQATSTAEGLPLDVLLNTRISTAAKYEQRVTGVPASVTVITAEEIARNGWHTLADALASVPGVNLTYDRGYTYLDQSRLRLGPTAFLTKSRCSLAEFETHVVRLLETFAGTTTEKKHAA